jgi:hypothetical protein
MLPLLARGLGRQGGGVCRALQAAQAQQTRSLNIHEYQGAQLMAKMGINVPEGLPAFTVDEVAAAAAKMQDAQGEVRRRPCRPRRPRLHPQRRPRRPRHALASRAGTGVARRAARRAGQAGAAWPRRNRRRAPARHAARGAPAAPAPRSSPRPPRPRAPPPPPKGCPEEPDPRGRPRPGALHQRAAGRRPHLQRRQGGGAGQAGGPRGRGPRGGRGGGGPHLRRPFAAAARVTALEVWGRRPPRARGPPHPPPCPTAPPRSTPCNPLRPPTHPTPAPPDAWRHAGD